MKKIVKTLIIDLDNTIFDWFEYWYASFHPIYAAVKSDLDVGEAELQELVREIHQERRTSEYPFLLEELEPLQEKYNGQNIRDIFSKAVSDAGTGRDIALKLYPTVFSSLWRIKQAGTKIVAYTESLGFYSAYRLKRFGLDGVIDIMFCPQDHELPEGIELDKIRRHPDSTYELEVTEVRYTPAGELKPNAQLLLDIMGMVDADSATTVYVGDGLYKDVLMAQNAGIFDIHAEYGVSQTDERYDLLRKVSHWTDEDVQREKEIVESGGDVVPKVKLANSFEEIFAYCDFVSYEECDLDLTLRAWEKTVDVQQHFNDMGMRIRSFAITLLGVMLTAVGFIFSEDLILSIKGWSFSAAIVVVIAAIVFWYMFYFMDKYWYHVLLRGASEHAATIESQYKKKIPAITLASKIFEASQNVRYFSKNLNSTARLRRFYGFGFLGLILLAIVLLFGTSTTQTNLDTHNLPLENQQPTDKNNEPPTGDSTDKES